MIPIEEAEKILNRITCRPKTEEVPLMESLGRVLGQDIVSRISMPPFNKSAMDGYALRWDDDSKTFKIVEVIAAGSVPVKTINKGECAKIMTGAMLPPGADRVIKVEVTEEKDGMMTITGEDNRENICYLGEDVKPGDMILKAGHMIRPPGVGIIASMGLRSATVYKRPTVGIVTTGSEIKEPGRELGPGQIYNSNAYSISAQVLQTGALVKYEGIVSDQVEIIKQKIKKLLAETQMVLISGGVSMGDYDYVPQILSDLGVQLHFDQVAIQPGKPTVFGTRGHTLVFGMPGNPVSTFIVFEVFVKPILYRTMGFNYTPLIIKGVMNKDFKRKRTVRTAYIPVRFNQENKVEAVEYHGSAHLTALSTANGLLKVPRGVQQVLKGSTVYVRQI
ncbi:MAG: molybdopterin molybdotransferase MoeA [Candidatus Aminicenantes bacterium]|jgi:molybdopterin molybdotransferase